MPLTPQQELLEKIINIGVWDMDLSAVKGVPHLIDDFAKIRTVNVIIRNDSEFENYDLLSNNGSETTVTTVAIQTDNLVLQRGVGGFFDDTSFDRTDFNRGWITIKYLP